MIIKLFSQFKFSSQFLIQLVGFDTKLTSDQSDVGDLSFCFINTSPVYK